MRSTRAPARARVVKAAALDGVVLPVAIVWHSFAVGWALGSWLGLGEGVRWTLLAVGWVAAVGYSFFLVPVLDVWWPGGSLGKSWQRVQVERRPREPDWNEDPSAAVVPQLGLEAAFVRNAVDVLSVVGWAFGMRGEGRTLGDRFVGTRPVFLT